MSRQSSTTATQHWPACRRQRSHHCSECTTQRHVWCSNSGRMSMLLPAFSSCTDYQSAGGYSSSDSIVTTLRSTWRMPSYLLLPADVVLVSGQHFQPTTCCRTYGPSSARALSHTPVRLRGSHCLETFCATSDSAVFRNQLKTHYFS